MSPSEPPAVGRLRVAASGPATEVRVVDARFDKVPLPAGNSGSFEVELPPGIYEVSFRDGSAWSSAPPVALFPGQEAEVAQPAAKVVKRTPKPKAAPAGTSLVVTLAGAKGDALAGRMTLADAGGAPGPDGQSAGASLAFAAGPGYWRLRFAVEGGDDLELPVAVWPGRLTRVDLATRAESDWAKRPDLADVAVRTEPAGGPAEAKDDRKLRENALATLAAGRLLHGEALNAEARRLLAAPDLNPMLGLLVGHLLPGSADAEKDLLSQLAARLGQLAGDASAFPDVAALSLRLARLRGEALPADPVTLPPTLKAAWDEVLLASKTLPDLVPDGSLADAVAARLWGPSPWVIWSRPPEEPAPAPRDPRPTRVAETLDPSAVDFAGGPSRSAAPPADAWTACFSIGRVLDSVEGRDWFRSAELGPEEQAVAQAIRPVAETEDRQTKIDRMRGRRPAEPTRWTAGRLAKVLGVPVGTAERAATRLADRLAEIPLPPLATEEKSAMARPDRIIPYDPAFLGDGFEVPMPGLSAALRRDAFGGGAPIHYTHYSLVMHQSRRVAAFTAHNVDAARAVRGVGASGQTWRMDERVGESQLGPEAYAGNKLDRGHLVRREDVVWGPVAEARAANKATFFYTNAAPQHENFNQDEWVALEDWVLHNATDFSFRLCVFTGPVLRPDDPTLKDLPANLRAAFNARQAQIPAAFWKVVVLRDGRAGGDDLSAVAFAMKQSEMWHDHGGRRLLHLKVHQVTLAAIEGWTGLDFGTLRDVDELAWTERAERARDLGTEPDWPVVRSADDIAYSGPSRRARGLRAGRGAAPEHLSEAQAERASGLDGDCGCGGGEFDAKSAVAALGESIARLTDAVAALEARSAAPERTLAPDEFDPAMPFSVPAEGPPGEEVPEPDRAVARRVEEMTAAAPDELKATVEEFASRVVVQAEVDAGRMPPPAGTASRIIGGLPVPRGRFASCCALGDATRWFCTGVLVAPRVVLTAAHCGAAITRVTIGGNKVTPTRDPDGRDVAVQRVAVHPGYRRHPANKNDITVLILAAPAGVPPTRLASDAEFLAAGDFDLVGFGYNDPNLPAGFGTKRHVTAPVLRLPPGAGAGGLPASLGFDPAYEVVAGRKGLGRDTCNGDSGGPAYVRLPAGGHAVAGLTSRATRTATVNCGDGGIYVRPSAFRAWIDGILAEAGLPKLG